MIHLASARKLHNGRHHSWEFFRSADGQFIAKRDDGEVRRRSSAAELLELVNFFRSQGFFVRKTKTLLDLAA